MDNFEWGEYILSPNQGETIKGLQEDYGNQVIPAWSLSALLGLIPNWTMDKTDKVNLKCNPYYHGKYSRMCGAYCYEDIVDAAFEMVCWLKENKKL